MFLRRSASSQSKLERTASSTSSIGGPEYSESGPELENAIMNKNWSLVRKCAMHGYGLARKNLLHKAIRNAAPLEIIELLVEKGCGVDEVQEGNWTPLHMAAKFESSPAVIQFLLNAGAHVNYMTSTGETPLFLACERDEDNTVDILIRAGADTNLSRSSDGLTPLMVVVHNHASPEQAAPHIMDVLLKAGANVNATSMDGATALLMACEKSCSESMLERLLLAGADVNHANKRGDTPLLILSRKHASTGLVEWLIKAGGDVNRANLNGETPIHVGAQHKINVPLMELFIRAGGNVNKASISGLTPVFSAVVEGAPEELVSLLLAHGADIQSHRFQRKTASEVAAERGFTHLLHLLDPAKPPSPVEFKRLEFSFTFCANCRKISNVADGGGVTLTPCGACGLVAYCSEECRIKHYKVGFHKDSCMAVLQRMDNDDDEE